MHPVRADADEIVERRESRRTATIGRKPERQKTCHSDGRSCGRHIRVLLVSDTSKCIQFKKIFHFKFNLNILL